MSVVTTSGNYSDTTQQTPSGLPGSVTPVAVNTTIKHSFANGAAADQVQLTYLKTLSLAAAATTLNLYDATSGTQVTDPYGNAIQFAAVRKLVIKHKGTTDGQPLKVYPGVIAAPAAPTLATATTGGSLAAGTYLVSYTWVNANGETTRSADASITTTGTTSTITVTIAALPAGVTSANIYVSTAGGATTTETRQNVATVTTTTFTLTSLAAGTTYPAVNTAINNGWTAIMTAGQLVIQPSTAANDAGLVLVAPNTTGWAVSTTSKLLVLDPGANTISVDIEITGV